MPRTLIQRPYPSFRHGTVQPRRMGQAEASLGVVPLASAHRSYGSVEFDGATWMTYGAAGAGLPLTRVTTPNQFATVSWFKLRDDSVTRSLWDSEVSAGVFTLLSGGIRCIVRLAGTTTVLLHVDLAVGAIPLNTWVCSMLSVNLANASERFWYIGDIAPTPTWNTYTDGAMAFTKDQWAMGAFFLGGTSCWNGWLGPQWVMPGVFLDFSKEYWRRRFVTANGRPVWMGSHGEAPTGQRPLSYHYVLRGENPNMYTLNRAATEQYKVNGNKLKAASDVP